MVLVSITAGISLSSLCSRDFDLVCIVCVFAVLSAYVSILSQDIGFVKYQIIIPSTIIMTSTAATVISSLIRTAANPLGQHPSNSDEKTEYKKFKYSV